MGLRLCSTLLSFNGVRHEASVTTYRALGDLLGTGEGDRSPIPSIEREVCERGFPHRQA